VTGDVLVSVLVPVLDEERHVERALELMRAQEGLDGELEILVADGNSADRTREIVSRIAAEDPRVRLLDNPDRRTPNGLNVCLRASRGAYVARMDAHTWYPADYLATGIARLRRGDAAWVAGPQLAHGEEGWSRLVALALTTRMGVGGAAFRTATEEREADSGFTGVWERETLERQNGWDEGWPINQDAELAARIRADGGRILCVPEMAAQYVPRDSLRKLGRQYWRYGQYRLKTSVRHPQSMRRSHVLPPGLVLAVASALLPGRLGRPGRLAVAAWTAAAAATSVSAARGEQGRPTDALALPVVFATMHGAWGAGFLAGCARFGLPVAALRRVLRP
jgi:glycosyltransferase involved in cell wall biosynthesis